MCETDMVRMAMRNHEPAKRPPAKRCVKDPGPQRPCGIVRDTAIDERPAHAVLDVGEHAVGLELQVTHCHGVLPIRR